MTLCNTLALAELAVPGLRQNGFDAAQISFVVRNFRDVPPSNGGADTMRRPGMGALISGLSGLLANMSILTVDDIGPVIAAGPLSILLRRDHTGGLAGVLRRLNLSDAGAEYFADAVRQGKVLVVVTTNENTVDRAIAVLKALNPVRIDCVSGDWHRADLEAASQRLAVPENGNVEESLESVKDPLVRGRSARS